MSERPNIVYVFSDQMRASTMGCMGDEPVQTPNLDRLAAQGVLFTHAFANTPVCTPSRASLLTGKHALNCQTFGNDVRLPEEEISIADALKASGYRTGYVGKWHLDGVSRHMFTPPGRRRHGFDDYWAAYNCNHNYFDPKWYEDGSPELKRAPGYDADIQTDQAIRFLERYQSEPICLFLSWGPPHDPYRMVPQQFLDMYPPDQLPLRLNAQGADMESIAGYYAHVSALDHNMGRLMEALERLGLADNTILVFSSDHGDMLWSQGRRNKQQPFEESIHVPLIVRWPARLSAGQVSDLLMGVVDHTPTLLGLAGVPVPQGMNGVDLSRSLLGDAGERPESLFIAEYVCYDQARDWQPWRGVRTSRYTYARWRQRGCLLFDNQADPYQLHNLALDPANAGLVADLEQNLQGWLEKIGDRFLTGEEHMAECGKAEEWQVRQEHFFGFSLRNF